MQKKIVALAVAGLSTAAFAQTNVTIYGVADVSGQGYNLKQTKSANAKPAGNVFALTNNSSLIGFKGTEDLGNGMSAIFQAETTLNLLGTDDGATSGGTGALAAQNQHGVFSALRDSYVGLNTKYGTGLMGYNSTPFRASLNSFDVMPGATGSGKIEQIMGSMRLTTAALAGNPASATTGATTAFSSSIRATSIAYAMPTLYGFNGSIAYTGSNNNGNSNQTAIGNTSIDCQSSLSSCTATPQSVFGFNLGWTGYGVNIQGAFQQADNNFSTATAGQTYNNLGNYTSYLVGTSYTGIAGLKASVVYNRNTLGTNGTVTGIGTGANKLTNNQLYAGASYRIGNWEPRISATWSSDVNGSEAQQLGARQWTLNTGYYLSKRTQVYGLISNLNNSANQNYAFGQQSASLKPTNGQNAFTYGMGLRTNF